MRCASFLNLHVHIPLHCNSSVKKDNIGINRTPPYCCPNHHRISLASCFTVGSRLSGFGVPQTQTPPDAGNSMKDEDSSDHSTRLQVV
jgi:hypothetical protein